MVNPGAVSVLGCSLNNDIRKAELPNISLNGHGSSDKLKYLGVSCRERTASKCKPGLTALKKIMVASHIE